MDYGGRRNNMNLLMIYGFAIRSHRSTEGDTGASMACVVCTCSIALTGSCVYPGALPQAPCALPRCRDNPYETIHLPVPACVRMAVETGQGHLVEPRRQSEQGNGSWMYHVLVRDHLPIKNRIVQKRIPQIISKTQPEQHCSVVPGCRWFLLFSMVCVSLIL